MNGSEIEQKIQAKGKTAPSVTPDDVEAAIDSEHYYTGQIAAETEGQHRALGGIMNCTLVMKNGHLITGEALLQDLSKPDPERARSSARRRAFDKAYDMVVYAERSRLANKMPCTCGPNQGCSNCPRPVLTEADAQADLDGPRRPDHHTD